MDPVEDLADGWDAAGTVGQEVYGAGIAFSTLARSYVRVPGRTAQVYCEYPFEVLDVSRDKRASGSSAIRAWCRVRVFAPDGAGCEQESLVGSVSGRVDAATQEMGWRDYMVPAGQEITVRF